MSLHGGTECALLHSVLVVWDWCLLRRIASIRSESASFGCASAHRGWNSCGPKNSLQWKSGTYPDCTTIIIGTVALNKMDLTSRREAQLCPSDGPALYSETRLANINSPDREIVPEGNIEPKPQVTCNMGTISLESATFEALLTDIAAATRPRLRDIILLAIAWEPDRYGTGGGRLESTMVR